MPKTILPPDVSAASFAAALQEFQAAIGKQWVFSSEEDLELYRDQYSFFWDTADEHLASAALAPASVEEVQKIVHIANKYKIPLYPISTGSNLTYGGAAPIMRGSVVVDLKRMNRVLEVNDKRHFALVEPGVSYFDCTGTSKSATSRCGWIVRIRAGAVRWQRAGPRRRLDRRSYRDHFGAHCGMKVVLPNGERCAPAWARCPMPKPGRIIAWAGPW